MRRILICVGIDVNHRVPRTSRWMRAPDSAMAGSRGGGSLARMLDESSRASPARLSISSSGLRPCFFTGFLRRSFLGGLGGSGLRAPAKQAPWTMACAGSSTGQSTARWRCARKLREKWASDLRGSMARGRFSSMSQIGSSRGSGFGQAPCSHSNSNHAETVAPGASTAGSRLKASGGPLCGSTHVAWEGSS